MPGLTTGTRRTHASTEERFTGLRRKKNAARRAPASNGSDCLTVVEPPEQRGPRNKQEDDMDRMGHYLVTFPNGSTECYAYRAKVDRLKRKFPPGALKVEFIHNDGKTKPA